MSNDQTRPPTFAELTPRQQADFVLMTRLGMARNQRLALLEQLSEPQLAELIEARRDPQIVRELIAAAQAPPRKDAPSGKTPKRDTAGARAVRRARGKKKTS